MHHVASPQQIQHIFTFSDSMVLHLIQASGCCFGGEGVLDEAGLGVRNARALPYFVAGGGEREDDDDLLALLLLLLSFKVGMSALVRVGVVVVDAPFDPLTLCEWSFSLMTGRLNLLCFLEVVVVALLGSDEDSE